MIETENPFIASLLGAMPDNHSRNCLLAALKPWGGGNVYVPVVDQQVERRRRVAASLLRSGASRAEAVDAIERRFGVARRTAYRDCLDALTNDE